MSSSRIDKKSTEAKKRTRRLQKKTSFIILGAVIAALIGSSAFFFSKSSRNVAASTNAGQTRQDKKYIATRNIVVDRETGRPRKPTEAEIKEVVDSLTTLTKRSDENPDGFALSGGGEAVDLGEGFGGVMLGRPNDDGTFETRCVFTFDEAAEFLGLVEENS